MKDISVTSGEVFTTEWHEIGKRLGARFLRNALPVSVSAEEKDEFLRELIKLAEFLPERHTGLEGLIQELQTADVDSDWTAMLG